MNRAAAIKCLLRAVCLLALAAPAARAGGFNLTWGSGCWRDNPATLRTSACDTNDGSVSFTVSFAPDRDLYVFLAFIAHLDFQSDSPVLPDWWQLTDPGGCRQGSLAISADFSAAPGGCADPWQGQPISYREVQWATAAFPGSFPTQAADRAHLYVLYATFPSVTLLGGVEYYGFRGTIHYDKTVGPGACAGCSTPVTIVLNTIWLRGSPGINTLRNALDNMCLRWQAGGVTPCSATPARSSTWGQVKSLYR